MCLWGLRHRNMTGAIIPALMHRIPSELRSLACLGESSTRMGDLLGSPRVAPLFFGLTGFHSGLPLVVPTGSASPSPSTPGDRRSGHSIERYEPSKWRV